MSKENFDEIHIKVENQLFWVNSLSGDATTYWLTSHFYITEDHTDQIFILQNNSEPWSQVILKISSLIQIQNVSQKKKNGEKKSKNICFLVFIIRYHHQPVDIYCWTQATQHRFLSRLHQLETTAMTTEVTSQWGPKQKMGKQMTNVTPKPIQCLYSVVTSLG